MTESQAPSVPSTSDQPPPSAGPSETGAGGRQQVIHSLRGILLPIGAILVALVISGLILLIAGYDPLEAFQVMWEGAFGDMRTISEVLLSLI